MGDSVAYMAGVNGLGILYVGITDNLRKRWAQHRARSWWYPELHRWLAGESAAWEALA